MRPARLSLPYRPPSRAFNATATAVRAYVAGQGVRLQMFTTLPPNHPAMIFPDAITAIMTEAVAADEPQDSSRKKAGERIR